MNASDETGVMETYFLGVYWGPRPESVQACAERVVHTLACLAKCDPLLARWYTLGETREAALTHEVPPDASVVRDLLLRDRTRFDDEHHAGFRLGMWNGGDDGESIQFSFHAGGNNPRIANTCNLDLSLYQGQAPERLLHVPPLLEILHCLVRCYAPDWGVVTSHQVFRQSPNPQGNAPVVGWLTYLSPQRGTLPPLPLPASSVRLEEAGTIVITTNERFTVHNTTHITTAEQIRRVLDSAGLLGALR